MFGGTFAGGGYGGYGGTAQAPPDGETDRPNAFGGGAFGGGQEAGAFNSLPPVGGSFGGAGYGAANNVQASQGLGGFLNAPGGQTANADGQRNQPPQRDGQSLMPLTLRMLLDAHEKSRTNDAQSGQDAPLVVNGKDIFCFTFVGCLDSVKREELYKVFVVNDGTAKINVKQYIDGQAAGQQELQAGEYVRVFGTFRTWGGDYHVSAHHVGRLESPNEVPFHFIEVAHVHLSLAGRIQSKAPVALQGGGSASSTACFKCGQPGHWSRDCPGSLGSAPPGMSGLGQQQPGASNTFPGAPGSFGAVNSTAPPPPLGGGGSSAGQNGGCFKCGQSGHWARDCPGSSDLGTGGKGGGGGSSAGQNGGCFKCGQSGHWASACPGSSGLGSGANTSPGLGLSGAYGGGMGGMGPGVQRSGFEPF